MIFVLLLLIQSSRFQFPRNNIQLSPERLHVTVSLHQLSFFECSLWEQFLLLSRHQRFYRLYTHLFNQRRIYRRGRGVQTPRGLKNACICVHPLSWWNFRFATVFNSWSHNAYDCSPFLNLNSSLRGRKQVNRQILFE